MAYARLGTMYNNLSEHDLAAKYTRKSYELRAKVSDRERLYIDSHYYDFVTGELGKSLQVYEVWRQIYPRDIQPYTNPARSYLMLGNYVKAREDSMCAHSTEQADSIPRKIHW